MLTLQWHTSDVNLGLASARVKDHSFVLSAPYILQSLMEMLFARFNGTRVLLVSCQI